MKKKDQSATYNSNCRVTSHRTKWFTDNNGVHHMILIVPEGIVIGSVHETGTTIEFVSNGQQHTAYWNHKINQRTLVTIAKLFAEKRANPLVGQKDGLLPCPICGEKPGSTEYNGRFIIRCEKEHLQIGTGSWMEEMTAIDAWNELSQHLKFIDDESECLPCPFCGETPSVDTYWGKLNSCHCSIHYVFGTSLDSIEEWNNSVRAGLARQTGGESAYSLPQLPTGVG